MVVEIWGRDCVVKESRVQRGLGWVQMWRDLLDAPPPEDSVFLQRVSFVERGVTLPAKMVMMVVLLYLLFVEQAMAWNFQAGLWLLCPPLAALLWWRRSR